jgi:DNA-binding transcriptional regulator YiaG
MNVKKIRQEMRWGQSWLSEQLGVSIQTISNWEHNRTAPPKMAQLAINWLVELERQRWINKPIPNK